MELLGQLKILKSVEFNRNQTQGKYLRSDHSYRAS